MPERRVAGDGVELSVHTWGDPTDATVVLVHGFPDTHAVWIPVAEALVDHGHHVVAYDVRGAGASGVPDALEGYRLEHLANDLRAVIDAVSPDRPVHLVGHDWGSIQSWPARAGGGLDGRIASYTSISGPGLDQAGRWVRARLRDRSFLTLLRQGVRSSYVAVFHLPGLARSAVALQRTIGRTRGLWSRRLRRVDGARVDDAWPAPTFGRDVAQGMGLYRANFREQLRHPGEAPRIEVPVLLVVPTRDRFVPEWLFEDIEELAPDLRRRLVPATHWVVRSQPVDVAAWIAELVVEVDATKDAPAPELEEAQP